MARHLGPDHVVIAEGLPGRTTVFDDPMDGEHLNGRRLLRACLESHKPVDVIGGRPIKWWALGLSLGDGGRL